MKKQSALPTSFVIALCVLASAMSASALSVEIHTTSEISGAQGNSIKLVAKHTGNLPSVPRVAFYIINQKGETEFVGRQESYAGDLWTMYWIAKEPGNYQVLAILTDGYFNFDRVEVARSVSTPITISGRAISIHDTSETTGAQGNSIKLVAQHTGRLSSVPKVEFYIVDQNGVTELIGRQESSLGGLWTAYWIAKEPGSYQVYSVLMDGHFSSDRVEVARSVSVPITITGRAISIHSSSEMSGAKGNLLNFVVKHTGRLPSVPRVSFFIVNQEGVTEFVGRQEDSLEGLWRMNWIAKEPGTYQLYAVLRDGYFNDAVEVVRSLSMPFTISGSAIAMHSSSSRTHSSGKTSQAVAVTYDRILNSARVFFYAVDVSTERTYELGYQSDPMGQLWSRNWTPPTNSQFFVYAVLRDGTSERSAELARTGNFVVVPEGTRIPDPFETVAGTYQALLPGGSRPMLTVQLTTKGAFSGRMALNGLTYPFSGQLASDGTAVIRSDLRNPPFLSMVLKSDSSSRMISGNYSLGQQSPVDFSLLPPAYAGKGVDVSPLSKKTANALLVSQSDGNNPLGHGYFRATFDAKGGAKVAGKMPDGRRLTGYAPALGAGVAGEATLPLSVVWKGKALATLIGDLEVCENAGESVPLLEGTVEWNVPADSKRKVLPGAIQSDFSVVGNLWTPVAGRNPLTSTGESVNFSFQADSGANILGTVLSVGGAWGSAVQPAISGLPAGTKWKYAPKTGIFTGQIPGSPARFVFEALLVPRSELTVDGNLLFGGGFLIGKGASAPLELLEAD